ncbi:MAG: hypothetical protein HC916_16480 [Coleofasciculaceae cyanobacterium SM2_1_6]|nr:hypothetical protein [Coleofasciculaceae cyanobacterium SM2_1_6]
MSPPSIAFHQPVITWETLPIDYPLPDDPVDNILQPLLAAALRESLELAGLVSADMIIATNFGICTKIDQQIAIKAPDWVYVPNAIPVEPGVNRRSYTPYTEGDPPAIVIEFLSDTDGTEYSSKATHPYGKWYFYERILQVPIYIIFEPRSGTMEVYDLRNGRYELRPNTTGRYWLEALQLSIGIWEGRKAEISTYWLRFWDQQDQLLLWGQELLNQKEELLAQEQQRLVQQEELLAAERQRLIQQEELLAQEQQEKIQAQQQLAQLQSQLRSLDIDLDRLSDS